MLIKKGCTNGRTCNLPRSSEVATLIVGDIGYEVSKRDIIIETNTGLLNQISELHPSYFSLQYPLLFQYGNDGFRDETFHGDSCSSLRKKSKVTMR